MNPEYIYMYTYVYIYMCVYVYVCIYIFYLPFGADKQILSDPVIYIQISQEQA